MNTLPTVGTIEYVSLPDEGIQAVPAKIDTGADSSAIWASDINEQGDQLSFVLFAKNSPFYTGQRITTKSYSVASIKNSFGKSELRYKVKLNLKLGERSIRARFTLANREHNRYPILIGRRTLHGKFLVDVTRKPVKQSMQVLMLSTKKTAVTATFAKNLESHGKKLQITYASYDDLRFHTGPKGSIVTLIDDGRDIADFDLVHFKTTARFMDVAAAAGRYLQHRDVPFIDQAISSFPSTSKLYQYVILADNDIPVPQSVFMLPGRLERAYDDLAETLGLPFVLKDIHGNKGEHNYLINDKLSFRKACKLAAKQNVQCIAQAFVPNDGDYRVLVFGARISMVIQRKRQNDDTHLNNTSRGAQAAIVPATVLPPKVQRQSIAGAMLMERQVAGVDIVQDKVSGLWYCLEVNDGPQLASGSFTSEKHAAFAAFLERKIGK